MNIKEVLEYGKNNLIEKEEPYRLSKILLKHILNEDDSYLLIHDNDEILEEVFLKYMEGIKLLNSGMPIQYITNVQEFMGLDFYVDENVLVPQPDTEILVEEVINLCKDKKNIRVLDLCAGSGAIGISIAKNIEDIKVLMTDISDKALEIAKKNAITNNVIDKSIILRSDMFEKINEKFDVIVSNPPYIEKELIKTLRKEVQNEPMIALDGGEDGLDFYKIIAKNAFKYLNKEGILALEIGYNQKESVTELLESMGEYKNIYSKKDLAGNDRIVVAKLNNI